MSMTKPNRMRKPPLQVGDNFNPWKFMGMNVPGWILEDPELSSDAKLLWSYLVQEDSWVRNSGGGENGPMPDVSMEARCAALGMSKANLLEAVLELDASGCIAEDGTLALPSWADLR